METSEHLAKGEDVKLIMQIITCYNINKKIYSKFESQKAYFSETVVMEYVLLFI